MSLHYVYRALDTTRLQFGRRDGLLVTSFSFSDRELSHLVLFGEQDGNSQSSSDWAIRATLPLIQADFMSRVRAHMLQSMEKWLDPQGHVSQVAPVEEWLQEMTLNAEASLSPLRERLAAKSNPRGGPSSKDHFPVGFCIATLAILPQRCVLFTLGDFRVATLSREGFQQQAADFALRLPSTGAVVTLAMFGHACFEKPHIRERRPLRTFPWTAPTKLLLYPARIDEAVDELAPELSVEQSCESIADRLLVRAASLYPNTRRYLLVMDLQVGPYFELDHAY
ncbi:hypothetical protein HPC49_47610 [Pyxidicoccus fallax]|uniref:Uncharacterized protein n=1 Tax=Pyxidicoccus fallax TaxID=394095 RepID=A0A848LXE5_9BACT|nr:hypothetical protein [Pyxidicoccus fallax]NMO22299.1 hypothetical protein [Pyxidicoccus fallax]NPC85846.1 hypothetical protein [Pyxidicoccus fallax]